MSTPSNSNRNSRASRESCELPHGSDDLSSDYYAASTCKADSMSFRLSQWPEETG